MPIPLENGYRIYFAIQHTSSSNANLYADFPNLLRMWNSSMNSRKSFFFTFFLFRLQVFTTSYYRNPQIPSFKRLFFMFPVKRFRLRTRLFVPVASLISSSMRANSALVFRTYSVFTPFSTLRPTISVLNGTAQAHGSSSAEHTYIPTLGSIFRISSARRTKGWNETDISGKSSLVH